MKKLIAALAALTLTGAVFAQAGTAVKEAGKATAETAKQGAENVKGAVTDEPNKTMHKAKARQHGRASKAAAKEVVN